jgi:uncharacterized membrane protein
MPALILVFSGSGAALAHEAHLKQVDAAPAEVAAPVPATVPAGGGTTPHDHSKHAAVPKVVTADAAGADQAGPENNVPKPLGWLGKFHPPLTHFPIALLTIAAVGELLFIRTDEVRFEHAVRFTVGFGAISSLAAATLGWFFAGFQLVDGEWPMTAHRWFGTATALLSVGLLLLSSRTRRSEESRKSFRIVLFASVALANVTGFLGGALIYGLDHYSW